MPARRAPIGDIVAGFVLVALAWYVVTTAAGFRGEGWLLPTVLAYFLGFGGIVLIGRPVLARLPFGRRSDRPRPPDQASRGADAKGAGEPSAEPRAFALLALLMPLALLVASIVYVWLIPRAGFYIASLLYIPAVLLMLGMRRWWIHLVTAGGFLTFVHFVFGRTFSIPLPRGAWLAGLF